MSAVDKETLDRAEGAAGANPGYRRSEVMVLTDAGPVTAVTYLATNKRAGLLLYP